MFLLFSNSRVGIHHFVEKAISVGIHQKSVLEFVISSKNHFIDCLILFPHIPANE